MSSTEDTPLTDPEEIVYIPLSEVPPVKIAPPGTPTNLPNLSEQRLYPTNLAIQQSGGCTSKKEKTTGIAFSGGGIRSAAFCSGALRRVLQKNVRREYLSCVSGGGYTGAAFMDWEYRQRLEPNQQQGRHHLESDDKLKKWHQEFFEQMRENAGYICNWQHPGWAIWESVRFISLLLFTVVLLPCVLWLPYAFPVAVAVDFLFGDILRESITCPEPVKTSLTRSSYLMMELYDDCSPASRRVALFTVTSLVSLAFFILSRCKLCGCCQTYRGHFRLLSTLAGLLFAFTIFPWLAHDLLWPVKAWIKVVVLLFCLILPFFFPIVRNYAGMFLFFFFYSYIVSWKVFKTELFGEVPYSDAVFYPVLIGCGLTIVAFPILGSVHQTCFNVYYRSRLSNAFFKRKAKFRWGDVFPWCRTVSKGVTGLFRGKHQRIPTAEDKDKELTFEDLESLPTKFISNITVNDWQIEGRAGNSHHLLAFSPSEVKVVGKYVDENGETVKPQDFQFNEHFLPKHMRLSSAMAISGAAVSFDMGSFENKLYMVMELLSLLGIGMGDEKACDQCAEDKKKWWQQCIPPLLTELVFCLPLIALPFVYYLGSSTDSVAYVVLVHIVMFVFLAGVAVLNTGSPQQDNTENNRCMRYMPTVIEWLVTRVFLVRFLRGFLNIPNVGTHPPPVLRLSDGGHFENLALLPLLEKKLKKIVIVDGSCNEGGDSYADALLLALRVARKKLHCSFEGMSGRDIEEDIRVKFLSKQPDGRLPRHYKFRVCYYDTDDGSEGDIPSSEGEILFIAPRHPRESRPLKRKVTEQPKPWKDEVFDDVELGKNPDAWGRGPEMDEEEADRLTWCCCHGCHRNVKTCKCCCVCCTCECCCDCCPRNICHTISSFCLGEFPHHITPNQFFTPDMFTAYHREGYAACVEAKIDEFLGVEEP